MHFHLELCLPAIFVNWLEVEVDSSAWQYINIWSNVGPCTGQWTKTWAEESQISELLNEMNAEY